MSAAEEPKEPLGSADEIAPEPGAPAEAKPQAAAQAPANEPGTRVEQAAAEARAEGETAAEFASALPAVAPQVETSQPGPEAAPEESTSAEAPASEAPAAAPEPSVAVHPSPIPPDPAAANAEVLARSRAHTRRSFLGAAAAAAAAVGFYKYLEHGPQIEDQPAPLRKALLWNAEVARTLGEVHVLAPTYPLHRAETLRLNGFYGLKQALVTESWRLQLVGMAAAASHPRYSKDVTAWEYQYEDSPFEQDRQQLTQVNPDVAPTLPRPNEAGDDETVDENHTGRRPRGFEEAGESNSTLPPRTSGLLLTIDDVLKLPRHELVTQFKCIEGWSQIVHWAGVRMADFLEAYPPAPIDGREPKYVYMETPDGDYYTGYDLDILRHPQTLLVTEMMGAPLTHLHGAPLRLHMPTKYGYKQIKRIGLIAYTNDKPDDYWTKLGYDWFAGL